MAAAAQAEARISSLADRSASMARQGVDSLTAAVKIVSDLTAEEVALGVRMVREGVSLRPSASMVQFSGRTLAGMIGAEKILLDLAAGETPLMVDGLKVGLRLPSRIAAMADLVPIGMGTFVDMSKGFLDDTLEQTQELVDSYVEDKPLMLQKRIKKFTQRQVESYVENQKKFLDQFAEQVNVATEGGEVAPDPIVHGRWHTLMQMAREGVDKFIDAEKKIMHLAIAHADSPMPPHRAKAPKRTSLADATRESVNNITAAQKSLLDVAMKPMRESEEEAPKPRTRPRARKTPRQARRKRA